MWYDIFWKKKVVQRVDILSSDILQLKEVTEFITPLMLLMLFELQPHGSFTKLARFNKPVAHSKKDFL